MDKAAVLCSGGLDSCVLAADYAQTCEVYPVYVRAGMVWEADEQQALKRFLDALNSPDIRPVTTLDMPVAPLYGRHWSLSGEGIPQAALEQSAFLPGRNLLLIAPTAAWCFLNDIWRIAIASVDANPFADATAEYFDLVSRTLTIGMEHEMRVEAPYVDMRKIDLIHKGKDWPLELTLTCIDPREGAHCGTCSKCDERRTAFQKALVPDRTRYLINP
jgi:7-cyano-7-deazaguanine synthase